MLKFPLKLGQDLETNAGTSEYLLRPLSEPFEETRRNRCLESGG